MVNLNKNQIINLLNIETPFLMLDKVTNLSPGKSALGIKDINNNEWFYQCHFPKNPVMPGTLQTEAMLQTVVLIYCYSKNINAQNCLINKVNSNFLSSISGKGKLEIFGEIVSSNELIIQGKAKMTFNEKLVCKGSFRFINPQKFNIKS